jgi:hypothetical protein
MTAGLDGRGTLFSSMNARPYGFGFALLVGYSYPATGREPAA